MAEKEARAGVGARDVMAFLAGVVDRVTHAGSLARGSAAMFRSPPQLLGAGTRYHGPMPRSPATLRFRVAALAELLAEPARVAIVLALFDDRARPAGELARLAEVAPSTASEHLARLVEGGLLSCTRQGRHRYYRLASPDIAHVIESLSAVDLRATRREPSPVVREGFAFARTCYRHLAGALSVRISSAMLARSWITLGTRGLSLTRKGHDALSEILPDLEPATAGVPCLDVTERRYHVGGPLGSLLLGAFRAQRWLLPTAESRVLCFTPLGERRLGALFGGKRES